MRRIIAVFALALPLLAVDLVWKSSVATPAWAYHDRSPLWLLTSVALVGAALVVTRIRSRAVLVSAGVMVGGVLGNALSGAWNNLSVPNPIIVTLGDGVIAFNPADVFTMIGISLLTGALAVTLIRNRNALPTRQEARAVWVRVHQRRP